MAVLIILSTGIPIMNKKSILKNCACALYGLTIILISSIFMVSIHYANSIESQIQNVSILKDIKFQEWGQQPNPTHSIYTQNFTLYSHSLKDNQILSTKSNFTQNFNFSFQYTNVSFAQGNSGRLNYIEHWMLDQDGTNNTAQIETLNYGAEKVYNYDNYAPPQRNLPILYNHLIQFLAGDFLELFYAQYLYEYFFSDEQLVIDTVFLPLDINVNDAKTIYNHDTLGWSKVQNFRNWVVLSMNGADYAKKSHFFEQCVLQLEINAQKMADLLYEKSTLYNMVAALNGTIKTKLMDTNKYKYKCQDKFCKSSQIAALQLGTGFLTREPVFASLSLNSTIKKLNISMPVDIEYVIFEQSLKKKQGISLETLGALFSSGAFGDFEKMNILWENQEKYDYIESVFNTGPNSGELLVGYANHLYKNLIKQYGDQFSWGFTNHQHFMTSIQKYSDFFLTELYSRAYQQKYLQAGIKCQDYFVNEFADLASLCQNEQWNIVNNIRNYMQAYLYIQKSRSQFADATSLTPQSMIFFFNDREKSLMASHLSEINGDFKTAFNCTGDICEAQQLFLMQWGANGIFPNLPTAYFPEKVSSILSWDNNNIFHGFNPDYYLQSGSKLSIAQCQELLNSHSGMFSLFNINSIAYLKKETKKLSYITKLVMHVAFQGIILSSDVSSLINGQKSFPVQEKKKMDVKFGGAPWMDDNVALVKLNNEMDIQNNEKEEYPQYSMLNTGIYDRKQLREILTIWGEQYSSSSYLLYQGEKYDDDGNLIEFSLFEKYTSNHKIAGTSMIGFHPMIQKGQNLQGYFQQGFSPIIWQFVQEIDYVSVHGNAENHITAYKYKLTDIDKELNIDIEELNHNSIKLMDSSYLIVQPVSGLTLEFSVIYQTLSRPTFIDLYLGNGQNNQLILYESNLFYTKTETDQLESISSTISSRDSLNLYGYIAGGVVIALSLALSVMYFRLPSQIQKDTLLMASQETI